MTERDTGLAIKVSYWMYERQDSNSIAAFRKELLENYIARVHGEPCYEKGGGLYSLLIEIISNVSFQSVALDLLSDAAYDLVKGFVLRPFLISLKKLLTNDKD